jgi:hypothetical protein
MVLDFPATGKTIKGRDLISTLETLTQLEQITHGLARKGVNPITKQQQVFAAKPASTRIRVRMLKKAQDAVK